MKVLIADDDFVARRLLKAIFEPYAEFDIVIDGRETVQAFKLALEEDKPYDVICLDIMMPNMDGQEALKKIREIERETGVRSTDEVKVIMMTALDDPKNVVEAMYQGGATAYIVKPIDKHLLLERIRSFGLMP